MVHAKEIEKLFVKIFFFSKIKTGPSVWRKGSNNQNLKGIRALGTGIIATRTDYGRTDGRRMNFDFMSSADSQAELTIAKNSNFTIILTNLVETLSGVYKNFWEKI